MMKRIPFDKSMLNDFSMAMLVITIIGVIIVPLPTWLLDALLSINVTMSVLMLMTAMFAPDALSMSTFPSLLLFTTLFRLSLNIASTKSILLHADAGHLITAFGELVVGGNFVVGIVVFVIITLVQFIVITKGSERVAEVGARFTLDAMPGKQMSIDADLRANVITGDQAKKRRNHLAQESQMHGAMDGAMKFVKGDSIAGLLITAINIVAGIIVGCMYHGMTAGEAANRFAVLSIGDAMVSSIPSLLICTASGVLTTRVSDDSEKKPKSLGQDIVGQMTRNERAMYLAAGLVAMFGMIPGFPLLAFLTLATVLVLGGYSMAKKRKREEAVALSKPINAMQREGAKGEPPSIRVDAPNISKPLAIRMSRELATTLLAEDLDGALERERSRLQELLGLPFPGISMWVSEELHDLRFEVLLNDVPAACVQLPGRLLWIPDPATSPLASRAERHGPVCDQQESLWIQPKGLTDAERATCLNIEQVLAKQTMSVLRRNAHLFMGVQEVQWVVDRASPEYPGLVEETKKILPMQRIAEVLRRLLEEQVPIRNVRTIFESLVVWGAKEKDMQVLTEYVRGDLGRFLAHEARQGQDGVLALMFDMNTEQAIRQCIKPTPAGNFLAMPPEQAALLVDRVIATLGDQAPPPGLAMITSLDIRRYVKKLIEPRLPWLRVYSYQELSGLVELKPVARISLEEA
jgi:type III secretion protein V